MTSKRIAPNTMNRQRRSLETLIVAEIVAINYEEIRLAERLVQLKADNASRAEWMRWESAVQSLRARAERLANIID